MSAFDEPRDRNGRLLPGAKLGRHGGRPKGVAALARAIQKEVGYGDELIHFVLRIFRNQAVMQKNGKPVLDANGDPVLIPGSYSDDQQWQALQWLSDRGFGKAVVSIDMTALIEQSEPGDESLTAKVIDHIDLMGDDELRQLESLTSGVLKRKRRVIDVPGEDE